MKILVVSDNHGDENGLELIHGYEDEIDHWFHCGDSISPRILYGTFKAVVKYGLSK